MSCRHLIVVLGDQLDADAITLRSADPAKDRVLMIESRGEAQHVRSHTHRIALCLSAMRHHADALRASGWNVDYQPLSAGHPSLASGLAAAIETHAPAAVWWVQPGEWRVRAALIDTATAAGVEWHEFDDTHFLVSLDDFNAWAKGRKQLTMEYFYRAQRKTTGILMDEDEPAGGRWNFDADNRQSFGRHGPGDVPAIPRFEPDAITREVLDEVAAAFADHPGDVDNFAWPVTAADAQRALDAFITDRLPNFGRYQDAMWAGEPFLFHALLGSCMNLKLLNPRAAIAAAVDAWERDPERYPLAAVEGFVRQILGWREFIRGIYWRFMPEYATRNHYGHERPLPDWFWTGDTDMNCLSESIRDTMRNGYAHHIQRLMVIGNYATLAGLAPVQVCDWFLAVYVDAIEWVELPNTLGMALHGDGGIVGSKPYVASGAYIKRMSNYCAGCRFRPTERTGEQACPFNALYWDFMARHREALGKSPRMRMVLKNLDRWSEDELAAIQASAAAHRDAL